MAGPPRLVRAHKHGWPALAVDALIRSKMRRGLHRVLAQGVERLRSALDAEPGGTLFLANHSCWWDLFLVHTLNRAIPVDGYGMMEHFNMVRFGFFRRIGAFSVDRTDPVSVRASLDYAASLLAGPRAGVWIFPQGRIESNDARPLRFQAGVRALIRRVGSARVVPVAFRYDFWQDERPEALVRFGEPARYGRADLPDLIPRLERQLTDEIDALKAESLAQDSGRFLAMASGKASASDTYARFRARVRGEAVAQA